MSGNKLNAAAKSIKDLFYSNPIDSKARFKFSACSLSLRACNPARGRAQILLNIIKFKTIPIYHFSQDMYIFTGAGMY